MDQSLINKFAEIEAHRKKILYSLSQISTEDLNRPPAAGKWSVNQILGHLITAEKLSVMYMQKKIQGIRDTQDSGLWEEFKMLILKISQRTPGLKFKAPKKVVELTVPYGDIHAITREWDHVRADLKNLLEGIQPDQIHRKIYRHVVVGYLSIIQAMSFFREHIIHHTPQIKKLVNLK